MKRLIAFCLMSYSLQTLAVDSDFEPPDFSAGTSVGGQGNWSVGTVYDEAVTAETDNQFWRISNALTDESFTIQPHSPPTSLYAGETLSFPASSHNSISAAFDFWSITGGPQPGLSVTHSFDEGDGGRLTFIDIEDNGSGLDVREVAYDGTSMNGFNSTVIASSLDYAQRHQLRVELCAVEGPAKVGIAPVVPPNDIVRYYLDGLLVYTGSSLEQMYIDGPDLDVNTPCLADQSAALSCAASASATATYVAGLESAYGVVVPAPQGSAEICSVLPASNDFPVPGQANSAGAKSCVLECEEQYWQTQQNGGQCTADNYANLIPANDMAYQQCVQSCDQSPWGVNQQLFRVSNAAVPALSGAGLGIDNVETVVFSQDCANPAVDLSADLQATPNTGLIPGDQVDVEITMRNEGSSFASQTVVEINLSAGLSVISNDCNLNAVGSLLVWNIGESGPADALSSDLLCHLLVDVTAGGNQSIEAEVSSFEADVNNLNNVDSVVLSVQLIAIPVFSSWEFVVLFLFMLVLIARTHLARHG
ncbi:MAG: hypothetical protein ACWA5R_12650 [bacterium]